MDSLEFNREFATDEELDGVLDELCNLIAEEDAKTQVLNPVRMKQLMVCYEALKYTTKGSDARVTYRVNEPFLKSMGCIEIVGKDISFSHPKWLQKIAEMASNVEIYPKTNGDVQMNYAFYGMTIPIE